MTPTQIVLSFGDGFGRKPWEINLSGGGTSVSFGGLMIPTGDVGWIADSGELRQVRYSEGSPQRLVIESNRLAPSPPPPKNLIRLDALYDKVTPGSFVLIERTESRAGPPLVARVEAVSSASVTDYGMPATKVTVLTLDRAWLTDADVSLADIRNVVVHLQSEALELAGEPYDADIGPVADGEVGIQ